ncbi:helix-turn-helix domain-containing protein [Paractinoplanes maris]|uniref:helix-turn-helix domain-containing protein n=1 Tax=Paractinoplanes maris TaxID=1734446 RepID=UPI0020200112|nr:helix-turn-helix domain-containing protein [Actinoplanes maris]
MDNQYLDNSRTRGRPKARPERSFDPAAPAPVLRFAEALRALRHQAGDPTYRELAPRALCSKASLSAAASGQRLPTWEVTSGFVRACDGDVEDWRERWRAARIALGLSPAPPTIDSEARVDLEPGGTPRFVGRDEPVADNADPKRCGCAADPAAVRTLDRVEVHTARQELLGVAELRHSPAHQASWGRFVPSDRMLYLRMDATITIVARRPATGTVGRPFTATFDGQAVYGDILLVEPGPVEIVVTVESPAGGGSATTACLSGGARGDG